MAKSLGIIIESAQLDISLSVWLIYQKAEDLSVGNNYWDWKYIHKSIRIIYNIKGVAFEFNK